MLTGVARWQRGCVLSAGAAPTASHSSTACRSFLLGSSAPAVSSSGGVSRVRIKRLPGGSCCSDN